MKTESAGKVAYERPYQVTMRFSESEILRMREIKTHLALAVRVSDSALAHQLTMMGLIAFERKHHKSGKV